VANFFLLSSLWFTFAVKRALLLYNPESGRRRHRRLEDVQAAAAAFNSAGIEPLVQAMRTPGSAASQVREAIARGCDAIIACGGDGSVHEVLPALVASPVALGVIPLGTANGLAHDLGLPHDSAQAARVLATAGTQPIAVPRIEYTRPDGSHDQRYFIVGAGAGADAEMMYRLALGFKQRWGMAAYYAESTRQWLRHSFPLFTAEFRHQQGPWRSAQVSQVLAIRITRFAGLLSRLAPGASLSRPDFQLVLFKTRSRLAFLRYMMGVWTNRLYSRPDVESLPATECRCFPIADGARSPSSAKRIYAEADGEVLGTLPVSFTMSNQAVNLLVPATASTQNAVL
jgi:diacylglycerol kinase family enzyme